MWRYTAWGLLLLFGLGACGSKPILESLTMKASDVRYQAHILAAEALRQAHFYADGSGLNLWPEFGVSDGFLFKLFMPLSRYLIRTRWGVPIVNGEIKGFFRVNDQGLHIGVAGCVLCHSGKAAGRYFIGLGNKEIDVFTMANDLHVDYSVYRRYFANSQNDAHSEMVERSAMLLVEYLRDPRTTNQTRGLVSGTQVFNWFFRDQGKPLPDDIPRAQVKVPALWGFATKRRVGLFADGFASGTQPINLMLVPLAGGQPLATVSRQIPKATQLMTHLDNLLPPAYPFAIDHLHASRGYSVYTQECARCHGSYRKDANGHPLYEHPRIPYEMVNTDSERLQAADMTAPIMLNGSLKHVVHSREQIGQAYIAPRLEGIWARFPYLHNGSIPNIDALLQPVTQRPRAFDIEDAGEANRFDQTRLGLKAPAHGSDDEIFLQQLGGDGERSVYDTRRPGHSNQGHEFGVHLSSTDKAALIEYLKSL